MATQPQYHCTVEKPYSRWVTRVHPAFADLNDPIERFWCRMPNCGASTTMKNDMNRHYKEWHPNVNHKPYDASTYADSRHVLGDAYYVAGILGTTADTMVDAKAMLAAQMQAPAHAQPPSQPSAAPAQAQAQGQAPVAGADSFITLPAALPAQPQPIAAQAAAPAPVQMAVPASIALPPPPPTVQAATSPPPQVPERVVIDLTSSTVSPATSDTARSPVQEPVVAIPSDNATDTLQVQPEDGHVDEEEEQIQDIHVEEEVEVREVEPENPNQDVGEAEPENTDQEVNEVMQGRTLQEFGQNPPFPDDDLFMEGRYYPGEEVESEEPTDYSAEEVGEVMGVVARDGHHPSIPSNSIFPTGSITGLTEAQRVVRSLTGYLGRERDETLDPDEAWRYERDSERYERTANLEGRKLS